MAESMRRMSNETPTPEQVGRLLDACGWSRAEVAFRMGVTHAALSRWASGAAPMKAVYWWFLRADVAADLGVFTWPPPSFDELMKLLRRK